MAEGKDRKIWVYDIETLRGCFTYTALNIDTSEIVQFVVHKFRDNLKDMIEHLQKDVKGHIGYNNLNFDYPIIHYIMDRAKEFDQYSSEYTVAMIYDRTQEIINNPYSAYLKDKDIKIPQLDLFRLWHFNNKARSQSLKGLQVAMNYKNVQEMPIHHSQANIFIEEISMILDYNLNDVLSTYEFYKKSIDKINLRKELNTKYKLNCLNYPDSKIGESLALKLYCDKSGKNPWDVKKLRSERSEIVLKDCIFRYITFRSPQFNKVLTKFKDTVIRETKGTFENSVVYEGFKYDFGLGGIHGSIKPGIYTTNDDYIIVDCDVASLYPSIAVINHLYPEHLGHEFVEVYKDMLNQRIVAKNNGDMVVSDGLKLALNSIYG